MIDRSLNYGRHLIQKFLKEATPFSSVLDIGAGNGDDLLFARELSPTVTLYAVESYPPYIKNMEKKQITVYPCNIEKDPLPFKDESLDVIIINQVFEHVKEVYWILNEISRVLKVNGKLIVGVPNLASLHNRLLLLLGQQPTAIHNNSAHLRGYTKNDFKQLLNSGFPNGYKLTGFGGSNFYPFPRNIAKPLATILPTMAWGIFMSWEKKQKYQNNSFLNYVVTHRLETNFYLGESDIT